MKIPERKSASDTVDLSRRRSFSQFVGNLLVTVEEARGHPHCALESLDDLPKEKFLKLIPKSSPDFQFKPAGNWLAARNRSTGKKQRLFELHLRNTTAFNLMNGTNTVEKIMNELSAAMQWDEEQSYSHVRNQTLKLVKTGVFTFATPLEY